MIGSFLSNRDISQLSQSCSFFKNLTQPISAVNKNKLTQIALCDEYALLLKKADGWVLVCGDNYNLHGELGLGYKYGQTEAVIIAQLSHIGQVFAGEAWSFFVREDGSVLACRNNSYGRLGLGQVGGQKKPVEIRGLTNIRQIAIGFNHTLFLKDDGTVLACGSNWMGQLGIINNKNNEYEPVPLSGLNNICQIAAGHSCSYFLQDDGSVLVCGDNKHGQLGLGHEDSQKTPTMIKDLTNVKQIIAYNHHVYFLKEDGSVLACGNNKHGQLGLGHKENQNKPALIKGLTNPHKIAAGKSHTFFLTHNDEILACGSNRKGTLLSLVHHKEQLVLF